MLQFDAQERGTVLQICLCELLSLCRSKVWEPSPGPYIPRGGLLWY